MSTLDIADPKLFRKTLGHYPTGVSIIAARHPDGTATGMTVGTFSSVSLNPPLIGFLPSRDSASWPQIERVGRFCANILSSRQGDLCRRFSSRVEDKFAGIDYRLSPGGQPVLPGALAWIDCKLLAVHEAGDHYFVLGEVQAHDAADTSPPLVFFRGEFGQFARL